MKKLMILAMMMAFLPVSIFAQDDMYYVPTKSAKAAKAMSSKNCPAKIGRDVDVDEYNRRFRSSYDIVGKDSLGNDIIEFTTGDGTATDTVFVYKGDDNDFPYTARMGIYDGYAGWYNPWLYPYRSFYYGFLDPYNYSFFPWDPYWYYDYYWGAWSPWHYGYLGWPYYGYYGYYGHPFGYYGGGVATVSYSRGGNLANNSPSSTSRTHSGSGYTAATHGSFGGRAVSRGTFANNVGSGSSGSRSSYTRSGARTSTLGGGNRTLGGGNRSYSTSRSYSSSYSSSRSYGSPSYSSSGSSYSSGGGSRSGGSFGGGGGGGGSRSGGSFGGGGRGR